ncbi:recombinase family protein [Eggerthella lenta]|uniref:recombinase family protein n=1 Tax=Eggerthella lenta TaxID=84112 RepID=UPI001C101C3A|nr:recombinase family protein [Eggerthella lenta]MBU5399312.1 recombinase family protein [Eggerthella lenta]
MIALYMRFSAADGDGTHESNSIAGQRAILHEFIDSNPVLAACEVREFVDDGFSGSNFDRPAVQELLALAREGKIDCIIVKDQSRFAREFIDAGTYIEQIFPFLRIRFIAIGDGYDSADADAQASLPDVAIRNIANASYCMETSVRIRSTLKTNWARGRRPHSMGPFGYVVDPENKYSLAIDEDAAPVVRRIYELALQGQTAGEIARLLNAEGRKIPSEYYRLKGWYGYEAKKPLAHPNWNSTGVSVVISNPVYKGTLECGKTSTAFLGQGPIRKTAPEERYVTENAHPAIVDSHTWELAQGVLRHSPKLKGRSFEPKSPFSGLVVRGECEHSMKRCERTVMESYFRCHCSCDVEQRRVAGSEVRESVVTALRKRVGVDEAEKLHKPAEEEKLGTDKRDKYLLLSAYERMVAGKITREDYLTLRAKVKEKTLLMPDAVPQKLMMGKTQGMRERELLAVLESGDEPLRDDVRAVVSAIRIFEGPRIEVELRPRPC